MNKRKKKKKKILFYLATKLGWLIILLLGKLSFIKVMGRHHLEKLKDKKVPFIYVLWHGRILLPSYILRNQGITPMISLHTDGEMIAQTVHKLGYQTVRGSSTRGGKEAFHNMVDVLNQGGCGVITPDGPRGPRHYLKPGALFIAQQAGAYLLPMCFSAKRKIQFNSWDRFILLLPFSKSVVIYGAPINVPKDLSQEQLKQLRSKFQDDMIQLEKQADEYFQK
jgi:lysophospholipid acyltransferase (LPLAT)-like uncharacterized protein